MTAKYLVVQLRQVEDEVEVEDEGERPAEPRFWTEPTPITCEDSQAVHKAIREVQDGPEDGDWRVFELVSGRYVKRVVVFKFDGAVPYGVEIT